MAKSRSEVLKGLIALGLTEDDAEEELRQREAEAERMVAAASPEERPTALREARAILRSDTPVFVTPPAPVSRRPSPLDLLRPRLALVRSTVRRAFSSLRGRCQAFTAGSRRRQALVTAVPAVAIVLISLAAVFNFTGADAADDQRIAQTLGARVEAFFAAQTPEAPPPPPPPHIAAAPRYDVLYTLTRKRLDGGKTFYLLLDPVDLSNANFKEDLKLLVRDLVAEHGAKISVEFHDDRASLVGSYRRFGEKSLTRAITPDEQAHEALHFIAAFSGKLETGMFLNTLQFFTAATSAHPVVGPYLEDIEFDPSQP